MTVQRVVIPSTSTGIKGGSHNGEMKHVCKALDECEFCPLTDQFNIWKQSNSEGHCVTSCAENF